MLKVGSVISSLFQLVLGVPSKLTLDAINKGLKVSEVFLEEGFELWLCNWGGALVAAFVMGSSEADGAAEEGGGKWDIIHLSGA